MNAPTPPKRKNRTVKYLSNRNLLEEIAKSKASYTTYLEEEHAAYTCTVEAEGAVTVEEALASLPQDLGSIARVYTFDHVPLDPDRKVASRAKNKTHKNVCFPPFQHWLLTVDGWVCVGKSHWTGGLSNGWFSDDHGCMTNELGKMLMLLVKRYATKGSWSGYSYRDEMECEALVNLMGTALKFNESKGDNPFAYYTSCLTNTFRKVWRDEQKQQEFRDDMLIIAGMAPSMARQVRDELNPQPLKRKAGRPAKAKTSDK